MFRLLFCFGKKFDTQPIQDDSLVLCRGGLLDLQSDPSRL